MNNLCQYIQKKDVVELIALLIALLATVLTSVFCKGFLVPMAISTVYFIFLLVYLIKQFWKYTVLNKNGRISVGLYIFSVYVKTYVVGPMMVFAYVHHSSSFTSLLKMTVLVSAVLLTIYLLILIIKKEKQEIFNTIIYYLPLIVLCFLW